MALKPLSFLRIPSNFSLCAGFSLALLCGLGCHAQTTPTVATHSTQSSASQADLDRRVEIVVRNKFQVPADISIHLGHRAPSAFAGYDTLPIVFSRAGAANPPVDFLISTDGKTLARMQTYDISRDPASIVSGAGRPFRGVANAPVQIVVFDDLECPFCARMHQQLFPGTIDHYKGDVQIAYKDFPLIELHPWAMRAAIDSNCVYAQSSIGYWSLVDYLHAHAGEIGGDQHNVAQANAQLDQITLDEGKRDKLDTTALKACIGKQDDSGIRASMKEGEALGVNATPILFVNGERIDGAQPAADVWKVIDRALLAKGITPPPEPAPAPSAGPAPAATSEPAATPTPAASPKH